MHPGNRSSLVPARRMAPHPAKSIDSKPPTRFSERPARYWPAISTRHRGWKGRILRHDICSKSFEDLSESFQQRVCHDQKASNERPAASGRVGLGMPDPRGSGSWPGRTDLMGRCPPCQQREAGLKSRVCSRIGPKMKRPSGGRRRVRSERLPRATPRSVAAMFSEDAELIDESGQRILGRPAIEQYYRPLFQARPKSTIEIAIDSLRFAEPRRCQGRRPHASQIEPTRRRLSGDTPFFISSRTGGGSIPAPRRIRCRGRPSRAV